MPENQKNEAKTNVLPVAQLEIERTGKIKEKVTDLHRELTISNTLIEALYPGIAVATVDLPQETMTDYEKSQVVQALAHLEFDGVRYALVGASSSAKDGKFYAVNQAYEKVIAERFQATAEAAVVYFGILVGPCKSLIQVPECRVMVVEDTELGTNDCRGWIKRSLFDRLNLPAGCFYQFRLAFGKTQAKGSLKVMEDEVAEIVEADIILPASSVKPEYKGPSRLARWLRHDARVFTGPIVVGIREVSRELEFGSSYTLLEHAPRESFDQEIKPFAVEQVRKLKRAVEENDLEALLNLLGSSEAQREVGDGRVHNPEYTSVENTTLEAVLKADGSGSMIYFPWVRDQLQRRLAEWAFKATTAGGLSFPAFALADDGFLVAHDGEVYCSADWMPKDSAYTRLMSERLLIVRYPIRTKEDLLPVTNKVTGDMVPMLLERLRDAGCPMAESDIMEKIVMRQLRLEGTLALHSETAKRNGGDYDFDTICVVESDRFPRFVEDRFNYQEHFTNTKQKLPKKKSAWFTLPAVALDACGNSIGSITTLKTRCLAAGRVELAEQLAVELQAALDQLKHGTRPNFKLIKAIREEVSGAAWLKAKEAQRVSELPMIVEAPETDVIGQLYNAVRPEIEELFTQAKRIRDYRGLVAYGAYPERMFTEAHKLCRMYAQRLGEIHEKRKNLEAAVEEATATLEGWKEQDGPRAKWELTFHLNQAKSALHHWEKDRKELKAVISHIQKWGRSRKGDRRLWLQALFDAAASGDGNGSVVFYALPQEMVNAISERTGGRPVVVALPDLGDGEVEIDEDGRVYLVSPSPDGKPFRRLLFQGQVTRDGEVLARPNGNGQLAVVKEVHPFPVVPGRSEARNGRVAFPETVQRPQVNINLSRQQAKQV
ncbi:MAG TPA: hypothetical protein VGX94_01420 [Terriglobia bacterium]|nr:hypothetical protein [Terriglobia bacterium]